ncbi:DUF2312 domain-containing protein [Beijerinckia indica]|uniref:UPF0335 protein Bind_3227 n=1 Tax=Beijerinckia indica subsp. indica (strain ATCC 9039 / DSM 1715 / NCIMB 8712) TaxID=395963 RepID=B2ID22_BEII9|nr:DUF2312 domain-containing protein [Beijerinckia indica]ACB96787.1 conserved hypothetical protein [Beijerinckia indica subsp. indica ATCC 9039]
MSEGNPGEASRGNGASRHGGSPHADIAETGVAAEELRQFVERVERLEEEKKALSDDIRDVYAEMKGRGFDVKVVRQIVRMRKQDHAERMEMEAILDLYMSALNM